ncbi:MAG: hypothetical protein WAT78_09110 [Rhizobiaceae bacterium]
MRGFLTALAVCLGLSSAVQAAELQNDRTLMLFGGAMVKGHMPGTALLPFASGLEGNYIAGAALQQNFRRFDNGLTIGGEIGLAARFGRESSGEAWAGVSLGHVGYKWGGLNIAPSLVIGLSAITKPIGMEVIRAAARGGNPHLLFYLGPELAFTHDSHPNISLVYRVHHRSGAWNTLGGMRDAHNANVIGLRIGF